MMYIYLYLGCSLLFLIIFLCVGKKSDFNWWQRLLMIVFAPLVIVFGICYLLFGILPQHIKENGFHDFLPRRKGKAYPISESQSRYLSKDYVCDGDKDTMTIDEFNKKYNKSLTLDDVYGQGYTERITPEEYYECKIFLPNRYAFQPNLPDTPYTRAAKALAHALAFDEYSDFEIMLTENPTFRFLWDFQASGKEDTILYLKRWFEARRKNHSNIRICVEWCPKQCRTCVALHFTDSEPIFVLFYIVSDMVFDIVIAPRFTNHSTSILCDLTRPQFTINRVQPYLHKQKDELEYQLICPTCGMESDMLDWYEFRMPVGKVGREGVLSICPNCERVVEILPTNNTIDQTIEPVAFPPVIESKSNVFHPHLLGVMTFQTEDDQMDFYENPWEVYKSKWKEYTEEGNLESGNDAAIITYNDGHATRDEVISLFKEIALKGNHNAMANIFTVLWGEEAYREATDWLECVCTLDNPSPRCIWNLAYMYYSGEDLSHNILHKDEAKAEELLQKILKLASLPDGDDSLVPKVCEFLSSFSKLNAFSANGILLHNLITNSVVKTESLKDKGEIFNVARSLAPAPGLKLGLQLASEMAHNIGDESRFYFYSTSGEEFKFSPKHLKVERSVMGAWQLYLLATAPTIMPVFWHGGYICRDFIFEESDLTKIKPIRRFDFSILNEDGILLPNVIMADDKTSADVYCTYWNDWKGLVREHVKVTFTDDGSAELSEPDEFVYYAYDCGIYF